MASGYAQSVALARWRLVGRERELEAVLAAYANGENGIVLTGAGGVGKTRFAREALARLAPEPGRVEWVTATRAAAAIDFGAVSHLLPAGVWTVDRLTILRRLAGHFRAIRDESGRPVVVVDDAHLLDPASAAFIHHLAAHNLAFLLVVVRAGEPVLDAVAALWKEDLIGRIDLHPLPDSATGLLLDDLFEGRLDVVSRRELVKYVAGNLLLLRELLQASAESGSLRRVDGIWRWSGAVPVTGRFVEVVEAQIGALDDELRTLVEAVACAEPLPVALLERVVDERAVAAAERRELVVTEVSGERLVARLRHPLHREVIRAALSPARARTVWLRLAGAADGTRATDLPPTWAWPAAAGASVAPEDLLPAARDALARADHRSAERLARAAQAGSGGAPADQLLAEILTHQGRYDEAAQELPGSPPPRAENSGRAHTRWCLTRAAILFWGGSDRAAAERTLAAARQRDMAEASRCWMLLFDGRGRDALRAGTDVLRAPDASPEAVITAAAAVTAVTGLGGDVEQATNVYRRGLAAAAHGEAGLPWERLQLGYAYCLVLLANGWLRDAWRLADQEYQAAAAAATSPVVGGWSALRGAVARAQGRIGPADRALREAMALLENYDAWGLARLCQAELAGAAALGGDADTAAALLRRADRHGQRPGRLIEPWVELSRAWTAAAAGNTSHAAALARHAADLARATGQPTHEATSLYAAARLGDARAVKARLGALAGRLPRRTSRTWPRPPPRWRTARRCRWSGRPAHSAISACICTPPRRPPRPPRRTTAPGGAPGPTAVSNWPPACGTSATRRAPRCWRATARRPR
jgi:type II secretory pathway predicted ATPase ExeA